MAKELDLDHRGAIVGLVGDGERIVFATAHPEGRPGGLFRAEAAQGKASSAALPTSARALAASGDAVLVAGADGRLYRAGLKAGAPSAWGPTLDPPATALAPTFDGWAALSGEAVVIIGGDGAPRQRLPLPEPGAVIASDASGRWLVVGTIRGGGHVFEAEARDTFLAAESAKLHEGPVTALCFEPDELAVLSAGADRALKRTHVRGMLEPEDRGGRQNHDQPIRAIADLGERFATGGPDGALKIWGRAKGSRRPQTLKSGAGRAVALAGLTFNGRPHVAIAGQDHRVRLYQLDANGKPVLKSATLHDAYHAAERAFAAREPQRRQKALRALAGYDDARAIALIAARAGEDDDRGLRVEATQLLGASDHPKAIDPLGDLLGSNTGEVRLAALAGLRRHHGAASFVPLDAALASGKADVGVAAVEALTALAKADDQAHLRVIRALDDRVREVRFAALAGLEALAPKADPAASLRALGSVHADLRWHALLRVYQRGLLGDATVQSALRRHGEDADARVRQVAFQVAVLARPALAAVLRGRDKDLHRQLHQLETHGKKEVALPKAKRVAVKTLTPADRRPLLDAMASRALDTCARGAVHLAAIQDPRAFGTLLQLSREPDADTRVAACRALEAQGDARGLQRLRHMLRDDTVAVRDAAFTAVRRLLDKAPLEAAVAGMAAPHVDVRQRALRGLIRSLKSKVPRGEHPGLGLLVQALHDPEPAVRTEAFKAAVNLPVHGGGADALRFALQSRHADVRREVLTEIMGEIAQGWAWPLLLELFDDPDAGVRSEAFEFARKKGRGKVPDPLAAALAAAHSDLRLEATKALSTQRSTAAEALLITALDDDHLQVRSTALAALEHAGADAALAAAMHSRHADVRIRAAAARAARGDAAAAGPLLEQLAEPKPEVADLATLWAARITDALSGLAGLEAAAAVPAIEALLASDDPAVRAAAADALAWCCPEDETGPLLAALRHADAPVQRAAALGLAWRGDATGNPVLAPKPPAPSRGRSRRRAALRVDPTALDDLFIAALCAGQPDAVLAFLDVDDRALRARALRLVMLLELRGSDGSGARSLAALSSKHPRVRLTAARLLERFADPAAFAAQVARLMNERREGTPWTIPLESLTTWADALVHGAGRLKVRAAALFAALDAEKQEAFDHAWAQFAERYRDALAALPDRAPPAAQAAPAEIADLVFGAYVGLSRLSGRASAAVRQTALSRLAAEVDAPDWDALAPVFLQAMRDDVAAVRAQAFGHLASLGYPPADLAAEALATGHRDVGVLGLEVLASEAGAAGADVLRGVLVRHTDGLEHEAATLLGKRIGEVEALVAGLEARSEQRRTASVAGLAERSADDAAALEALRSALEVRFEDVRDRTALALGRRQDPASFDALLQMLSRPDGRAQQRAIAALTSLGDARATTAFLDRIADDPRGTAERDRLLAAVGRFRRPEDVDRLMRALDDDAQRQAAFRAALSISGYDQPLGDGDDPDEGWLEGQHPRHDAVLTRLLTEAHARGDAQMARALLPGARWAKGDVVDAALAPFADFGDERVRRTAVEAIGWRARARGGPTDGLIAALGHADPQTGFIAAEGLALAGHADGISTLLSAVELAESVNERARAVKALGTLGDARALDVLLNLANTPEHALQESAAEAIGHLADTDGAEQIFTVLKRLARGDDEVAQQALTGLRWFGGRDAWAIIRGRAADDDWSVRERVAELLAFHDDPAAREALLERIREDDDWDVLRAAAKSARQQFGPDSLEPDYAFFVCDDADIDDTFIERLADRGDPARILSLLSQAGADDSIQPIVAALLERDPPPVAAAVDVLASTHHVVGTVAARILGQAGALARGHGDAVAAAVADQAAAWRRRRATLGTQADHDDPLTALTARLRQLAWACGRLAVAEAALVDLSRLDGAGAAGRPVRAAAITALAGGDGGPAALSALEAVVTGADAQLRTIAAAGLARLDPGRASALLPATLHDGPTLARLLGVADAAAATSALRDGAADVHAQGVALPHLIARGDVTGLSATASDRDRDEATRAGAVEALARIATDSAQAALVVVGADEENDESLRKAAWRGLRRARRQRARQEVTP